MEGRTLVEGGEEEAELALGVRLGAAHSEVLASAPAEGVASLFDGELPRAKGALADGAFHGLL